MKIFTMGLALIMVIGQIIPNIMLGTTVLPVKEEGIGFQISAETNVDELYKEKPTTEALDILHDLSSQQEIMALVYLSDYYSVQSNISDDRTEVVNVPSGQQVQIKSIVTSENGEVWAKVTLEFKDIAYEGFILRSNLACSDERFLAWEETYGIPKTATSSYSSRSSRVEYADINQFPESYHASLVALKRAHPNWTFVKMNTGLEWNTVVNAQLEKPRSLVPNSFSNYMKDGVYGQGWSHASKMAVEYYLDSRNWLKEKYIFQFEQLTYNKSYHSAVAIQNILNSTFMKGVVPEDTRTYAKVFYDVGSSLGVSPFHLASRVVHEQGPGTSPLIAGNYLGYEGLYNHFNIAASGSNDAEVIKNGLEYAKRKNWTSPYLSIAGGADIISRNYIKKGQDTLYLQKFDVDPIGGLYWHQYMQNLAAPSNESTSIYKLYDSVQSINNTFVFKIPVYNNMPSTPEVPGSSYKITLSPPKGYNDINIYIDGVPHKATIINGQLVVDPLNGNATSAIMYKYNEAGIPIGMYVWSLTYNSGNYQSTPLPEFEDLLSYHGFSIRVTGNSGIRFKTGISSDTRNKLTSTGLAGYTLKESGTLVMNNANSSKYPFIKDGSKVKSGQSYGVNENGDFVDAIYETINGRHRFTSVLIKLPVSQYKTNFAFRGYVILENKGKDIILYGPPVNRSIYSLSQQALASGQYSVDSDAGKFLNKLIKDADNYKAKTTTSKQGDE